MKLFGLNLNLSKRDLICGRYDAIAAIIQFCVERSPSRSIIALIHARSYRSSLNLLGNIIIVDGE
jgi:hypothetical protein